MLVRSRSCNLLRPVFVIEISIASIINNLLCRQRNKKKLSAFADIVPMALNNIELNATLLAEIYKNSLVEIDDQSHSIQVTPSTLQTQIPARDNSTTNSASITWKHLGEFKKR